MTCELPDQAVPSWAAGGSPAPLPATGGSGWCVCVQLSPWPAVCRGSTGGGGPGWPLHGGCVCHWIAWVGSDIYWTNASLPLPLPLSLPIPLTGVHALTCRQTIHHLPEPRCLHGYTVSSTLQIGDPAVIAGQCGVTTVGDFRMADIAVGGQGAPLVPYMDQTLLQHHQSQTGRVGLLLNIGGISNISVLVPSTGELVGFDCGPGEGYM